MVAWFKSRGKQVLIGTALVALPLVYFMYQGVSWRPLNPHEHIIQNGLAYIRYTLVTVCCILVVTFLPYRIEQWAYFKSLQDNSLLAWGRQIFVEEMMLKPHFSPPDQILPNELDPFINPHTKQGLFLPPNGPRPDRRRPGDHHGPPFTLLLPVKGTLTLTLS